MKQLLLLLCCLEMLCTTWLINTTGPYIAPLLYFGIAIGIGFLYLKIATEPAPVIPSPALKISPRVVTILMWVLYFVFTYYIFSKLKHLWWYNQKYGDPQSRSDIIPQITTLVQRFLNGEQPYREIQFFDYVLFPTYMPFQWLPYMLTEWAKKDYRWIPTFGMWFATLYYFLKNYRNTPKKIWDLLMPIWPMVVWLVFILHDNRMFVYTVEGLIAAYYFFVAESISRKHMLPLVIGIAICLLSRYSIVFWVPLFLFVLFISGARKKAVYVSIALLAAFIVFYWYPFLRLDSTIFLKGYAYHTQAAAQEWLHDMKVFGGEVYLYNGIGFTPYAMAWFPGDLGHKLMLYKNLHLTMCIATVIGLAWFYARNREKYPLQVFLLFSFKVYLVVFYVFIQIPYKYLHFVPVMVSASLLAAAYRTTNVKES